MIQVNPGDLNLQTLAGNAALAIDGSDLPNLLYVFGIGEADYDYYLDPIIENAESLAEFLRNKNFNVVVRMPYTPKQRPAVGIRRMIRAEKIDEATELAIITLLHVNNRLAL
jgi:hypothetical protein